MKKILILVFTTIFLYANAYNHEKISPLNVETYNIPDFQGILLSEAETWLGVKYNYGGTTRKGVDCSAFVRNVVKQSWNVQLPRNSTSQFQYTASISKSDIQEGDLVFFYNSKGVYHVGFIYNIDGKDIQFIHAASSKGVSIAYLNKGYWSKQKKKYTRIFL